MPHIIKQQILDLTLDSRLDSFRTQQLVSDHYWNSVVPNLERLFDAIGRERGIGEEEGREEEVIEIDKLEIDLGVVTMESIEENKWSAGIGAKMQEALNALIRLSPNPARGGKNSSRLSIFRQWRYYMEHGYLPWNSIRADEGWYREVLEAMAVDLESIGILRRMILQRDLLRRIVSQHSEIFLLHITEILTARKQDQLLEAIHELVVLSLFWQQRRKEERTEKDSRTSLWKKVLELAADAHERMDRTPLAEQVLLSVMQENAAGYTLPAKIASRARIMGPLFLQLAAVLKARRKEEKKKLSQLIRKIQEETTGPVSKHSPDARSAEKDKKGRGEVPDGGGGMAGSGMAPEDISGAYGSILRDVEEEGIFVANAGLVLLHPFLNSLFTRLGLLSGGKFPDRNRHQRALYLLHYLAMGTTEAAEHELVVAKVLCSWSLEEPVDAAMDIPEEEIREADDLLLAAIQQWEMLKDASPAALREGFLQRNGKLVARNGSLYLRVETSSIDLLLDYLPWSLSMIYLPWMKDILRVEWR